METSYDSRVPIECLRAKNNRCNFNYKWALEVDKTTNSCLDSNYHGSSYQSRFSSILDHKLVYIKEEMKIWYRLLSYHETKY